MIKCKTIDCINIKRDTFECKLTKIEVNARRECLSYGLDFEYFKQTLRDHIKMMAPRFNSIDESTQEMVQVARRLVNE